MEVIESEFAHGFAKQAFVSEYHAAIGDPAGRFHQVLLTHTTNDEAELIQMRLRTDGHDHIAHMQRGFRRSGGDFCRHGGAMP